MKTNLLANISAMLICAALSAATPAAGDESSSLNRTASIHGGFFYPGGVDIAGYTVEHKLGNNFYGYYTFGFPSFAAAGFSCYKNYNNNGPVATVGAGVGPGFYAVLLYQLRIAEKQFMKLGGGFANGIAYTGAFPVISYEIRF